MSPNVRGFKHTMLVFHPRRRRAFTLPHVHFLLLRTERDAEPGRDEVFGSGDSIVLDVGEAIVDNRSLMILISDTTTLASTLTHHGHPSVKNISGQ